MMPGRLSNQTLRVLPDTVKVPDYDRAAVLPGIVHLGVGAFHRAHQAAYVEDCLAAGETGWGIVGASLQSATTHDALAPQDGLYTLAVRSGEGETLRVVGSLLSLVVAPQDLAALLDILIDPRIRIVTLTITEKAYLRDGAGNLDAKHPAIIADLAAPDTPRSAPGFLVEALARRRAAGTQPFTVLSCDNLPANGETLHRLLVQFAELRGDAALRRHIAEDVACPSSMVDRIVPATTDADRERISASLGIEDAWPVMTEPFSQWVIEDRFPAGRPKWEKFGVTMVDDVRPFEDMKLRLLNGAHSSIAYIGLLSGHETVAGAFADPAIRRFIDGLWHEAIPTLPQGAGLDPDSYICALATRFSNTALAHRIAQIGNDGSQKLPQRIIASAIDRLDSDASANHLTLSVAAWIRACELRGASLAEGLFTDPLDQKLATIAQAGLPGAETVVAVFDAAGFATSSSQRSALETLIANHLEILRKGGPGAALAALAGDSVA
ncbi:mannitol dehydrogenase family protein [Mesorhizobium sp. 10J20-29]